MFNRYFIKINNPLSLWGKRGLMGGLQYPLYYQGGYNDDGLSLKGTYAKERDVDND